MYAGFWKRFAANFIDQFILNIGVTILAFILGIFLGLFNLAAGYGEESLSDDSPFSLLIGIVLGFGVPWLYHSLFESSSLQATPGKLALGIKVTDLDGNRVSFGKATGRFFGKILSGLILLIGFIMAGFTEKKQALHDMMAGTLVVDKFFTPFDSNKSDNFNTY
ncbi:MAG: RDD family protein [Clostridia bacterium]|nr:RDD family protein [Clostridia bacterium]